MRASASPIFLAGARSASGLSKWRELCELLAGCRDIGALPPEKIVDCPPQARIGDVVRRIGRCRKIAARNLVLALRSGLHAQELALNGVLDRLVIAELEMQEGMMLDGAPMPSEQRVGADEIDGTCDPAPRALGHDQEDAVAHSCPNHRIERTREIGPAPLAR